MKSFVACILTSLAIVLIAMTSVTSAAGAIYLMEGKAAVCDHMVALERGSEVYKLPKEGATKVTAVVQQGKLEIENFSRHDNILVRVANAMGEWRQLGVEGKDPQRLALEDLEMQNYDGMIFHYIGELPTDMIKAKKI